MSATLRALQDIWNSRDARERKLLIIALVVVFLGSVYGLILDPAWTGLNTLKTSLPAAQARQAQVQQLTAQIQANPVANAAPNQASLQASLSAANINATVSAAAPWVITINTATGDALWTWLKTNNATKTTLKRNPTGTWSGELTLEP